MVTDINVQENNSLYNEKIRMIKNKDKIYKFYIYKKKLKDGFILSIVILVIAYFLNYFKLFSFLNYIIWFILFSSGLLGILFMYTFIKTIIEGIDIVIIKQEAERNISGKSLNDIFNK